MSLIAPEAKSSSQDASSQIRRAYKVALDAARRIKDGNNKTDIFTVSQKQMRQKLRDNMRRCILASPEEYGPMKLEETAWKYTVHGVIQRLKKDYRGSKSEITQINMRSFLDASYGWYKSFMFQLLDKLNENGGAENIHFDWWNADNNDDDDKKVDETEEQAADKNKVNTILLNLCYKCLMYLGDICRYACDLLPSFYSSKLPYRYYMQAWHLFPNLGMPWNQVGTLMSNKYHGVFSLFFYRRCLQSESPYSDSFQNLKRMTDRAKKNYQIYPRNQMDNLSLDASASERKLAVYWFCTVFLHLNGMFHPATYCTERELNTGCRRMLDLLDLCLYFDPADSEGEALVDPNADSKPGFIKRAAVTIDGPDCLHSNFLVIVFATLIQNFDDLRKQKSNRLKAANALFVAAADHVVNHAIQQILECVRLEPATASCSSAADRASPDFPDGPDFGDSDPELEEEAASVQIAKTKPVSKRTSPPKSAMSRYRRGGLDADLSEGESDLSEVSEEEDEICYSTDSANSTFSQEMDSEDEPRMNHVQHASSSRNTNNNTNGPKDGPETIIEEEETESAEAQSSASITRIVDAPRKLACSFGIKKNDVVDDIKQEDSDSDSESNSDEEEEMIFEFDDGVEETQVQENTEHKIDSEKDDEEEEELEQEVETLDYSLLSELFEKFHVLPSLKIICDWLLANGDIIEECESSPLWSRLVKIFHSFELELLLEEKKDVSDLAMKMATGDETWIQPFSLWEDRFLNGIPIMSDCHEHVDFKTNPRLSQWEENLLRFCSIRKLLKSCADKYQTTGITHEGDRFAGKEVKDVDDEFNIKGTFYGDNEGSDQKMSGTYVIPTPAALCSSIEGVKKINDSENNHMIITNMTIDGLDLMKKDSKDAREVTKWLDIAFSRCEGNLKSIQQHEQRNLQRIRRFDASGWVIHHLVNQGIRLQKQRKDVVLLIDSVKSETTPEVKKALQIASANNLQIQTVEEFVRLAATND